jgi:hypothetical protein
MLLHARASITVSLIIALLQVAAAVAQHSNLVPAAPVPPQIAAAKKVFIANAGGDERWYDEQIFDGSLERAYDEFYARVKAAGRYEIVSTPAEADLILEIGLSAPMVSGVGARTDTWGSKPFDPQFRLVIRDAKMNVLLWAFTEHVQWAIQSGNREKNFEKTLTRVMSDLQGLSASKGIE